MSVAIISQPALITPLYMDHFVDMYDSARSANADLYYQIDITVGSETRSLKQLPDLNKHAIINISKILQSFNESSILVHSAFIQYNSPITYSFVVKSISGGTTTTASSSTLYSINGVLQAYETQNYLDYLPKTGNTINFLNNWTSDKNIHPNDVIYLSTLTGTWGGVTTNFAGLTVTIYYKNGTSVTRTISVSPSATPYIASINVGPTALNVADNLLVFTNALYYTVKSGTIISQVKINIVDVDARFDKYFRIAFIGKLGTTEFQNFDLENQNTISVAKTEYANNDISKVYNTEVDDIYTILSDFMTENQSLDLKYLWISPVVAEVVSTSVIKPIILLLNELNVLRRRNNKTINYSVRFKYADKYKSYRQ